MVRSEIIAVPEAVNDPERLAALRRTMLLDTANEHAFDRLTRLAATILNAPVALVSLVDENRQFFKSCVGLPEPWASMRETPLSHSFCQYAVDTRSPLIIADARIHPLVHENLAIRDLNVIAYAGIPLITADGFALGSFCVIDDHPREWTSEEVGILTDLAASVVTEIELRLATRQADLRAQEAERERQIKDEVLASITDAFYTLDREWRFTYLNQAAINFFACQGELLGRNQWEVFPESRNNEFGRLLEHAMAQRETIYVESLYEPTQRWYEIHAYPAHNGLSVYFGDVTERVQIEQQVRDSEIQLSRILNSIVDGVLFVDANDQITFANSAAETILGEPLGVLLGSTHLSPIQHMVDAAGTPLSLLLNTYRQTADTSAGNDIELCFERADGRRFVLCVSVASLREAAGTTGGLVISFVDRTAAVQAEQSQWLLSEASRLLQLSLDVEQMMLDIAQLIASEVADWCTVHLLENERLHCVGFATRQPTSPAIAAALQRECQLAHASDPLNIVLSTGQHMVVAATSEEALLPPAVYVPLIANGRTLGVVTLAWDQCSADIRDHIDFALILELAKRIALAVENAQLYTFAQQALAVRDEFLSMVVHDLKNPLSAIKGSADLLQRRLGQAQEIDLARVGQGVERIQSSAAKMMLQIEELLAASVKRGDVPNAPVASEIDISTIVAQVVHELQLASPHHHLQLHDDDQRLLGRFHISQLDRVFSNLISNAVKYSPEGSSVQIAVGLHEGSWARVQVSDQGMGIPAADLPFVFERYRRGSNVHAIAGSGVGLASVQQIVAGCGGTISVESTEGRGSVFIVLLPIRAE